MDPITSYWTLFTSSFLAATLLPGGSELVFYGVLELYPDKKWTLIGIATLGNTLGGLTSYAIGRAIPRPKPLKGLERADARTMPMKGLERADARTTPMKGLALLQRYGSPALLLAWVPLIGDPLCVAAGWLRMNAAAATTFIAAGKLARYAAIAAFMA
ncbi:MAG: DedA family protein [Betaproteobacteria bacterium]|nr:DedA family protein [Betaproteobacteria bacterium]